MNLERGTAVANEDRLQWSGGQDGKRKRRSFTIEDKARITQEASSCRLRGELSALLRREGISHSHLTAWRRRMETMGAKGLASQRPGPKPHNDTRDRLIEKQQRAISELEHELSVVNALVKLQRMCRESLVDGLPEARRTQQARLVQLVVEQASDLPLRRVCEALGVSRATLYRRRHTLAS